MSRQAVLVLLLLLGAAMVAVLLLQLSPTGSPEGLKKVAETAGGTTAVTGEATRAKKADLPTPKSDAAKYIPPTVQNPALVSFVNRESKEERVTGDIHVRLPKVDHPDDVKAVAGVLLDTQDDDTVRHEAANLLRRSNYAGLTADLLKVLRSPEEKERFRAFATQHLWSQAVGLDGAGRSEIVSELKACLSDRHTSVRREALLALVRLNDPCGMETALIWFAEPKPENDGVQDLCIRVIRERDMREHLPAVRNLIKSPNEDAARQAMVTVGQWGDQESRPLLEEAANSTRPLVKRAADAALKKLDQAKAGPPQPDNKGSTETPKTPANEEPKTKF